MITMMDDDDFDSNQAAVAAVTSRIGLGEVKGKLMNNKVQMQQYQQSKESC